MFFNFGCCHHRCRCERPTWDNCRCDKIGIAIKTGIIAIKTGIIAIKIGTIKDGRIIVAVSINVMMTNKIGEEIVNVFLFHL